MIDGWGIAAVRCSDAFFPKCGKKISALFVCFLRAFKDEQIARNRRVKELLDLRKVACLRQNPHQLGYDRLGRHRVCLQNAGLSRRTRADLINGKVAALMRNLRRDDNRLACAGISGSMMRI